ncbi:MAG: cupin domain-containing protein [Deltaproteobacteria bacterium]|nr:cupin domain-containing protein [Deltaproteobacteria bacterium]
MTVRRVGKPWGHELIWAETPQYIGKILVVRKGERLSYQYHREKDESIYLAQGVMDFESEQDGRRTVRRLQVGETVHIPPGMRHRMTAVEECRIFEVSTPHPDDIVRLEDHYGRAESKSVV